MPRLVPATSPFPGPARLDRQAPWQSAPQWPARWVHPPEPLVTPWVGLFRLAFELPGPARLRLAVTADERFELWLDGRRVARGPDRGDRSAWFYATHQFDLAAGAHVWVARVWALGELAPAAQVSVRPGFLLAGEGEAHPRCSTGLAPWEFRPLGGHRFTRRALVGPDESVDLAQWPEDWARGGGDDWQPARPGASGNNGFHLYPLHPVHLLAPSELPEQRHAEVFGFGLRHADGVVEAGRPVGIAGEDPAVDPEWAAWAASGAERVVPPHTAVRLLLDLGHYRCGYPILPVRGGAGAEIALTWTEALLDPPAEDGSTGDVARRKGRRDAVAGRVAEGPTDHWRLDGREHRLSTLWWRAGRFWELRLRTAAAPLRLEAPRLEETGYPFAEISRPVGEVRWERLMEVCLRTLRACAHETLMDCPHYEQLAYAGDARVQLLCWYRLCPDDTALARHTLGHFARSARNPSGWPSSSAPSGGGQLIPPFALWWVAMADDYLAHTAAAAFLRPLLPTVREVLERWLSDRDPANGLARSPAGWNFLDAAFPQGGVPPGGWPGEVSANLNWQLVLALQAAGRLERAAGAEVFADRWEVAASDLRQALHRHAWDDGRGLFADVPGGTGFSEHGQSLAVLAGGLPEPWRERLAAGLRSGRDLLPAQAYFSYYTFAAARTLGLADWIERRLETWHALLGEGFTTTPEHFGPTRSDCHAWSAHPVLLAWERSAPPDAAGTPPRPSPPGPHSAGGVSSKEK